MNGVTNNKIDIWSDLPQGLSEKESAALIEEYRRTHDEKLRNQIVLGNLKSVAEFLEEDFFGTFEGNISGAFEKEDLLQDASLAIMMAVEKFDTAKNTSFKRYLFQAVRRRELNRLFPENAKDYQTISYQSKKPVAGESRLALDEIISDGKLFSEDADAKMDFNYIMNSLVPQLPEKDAAIFESFYGRGQTQKELAKQYGVTRQNISLTLKRCVKQIRQLYQHGKIMRPIFKDIGGKQVYYWDVEKFLTRIEPNEAAALRMRFVEGKKFKEIGDALGVNERTASTFAQNAATRVYKMHTTDLQKQNSVKKITLPKYDVEKVMQTLSPKEIRIISDFRNTNLSQVKIAEKYNVSEDLVSRTVSKFYDRCSAHNVNIQDLRAKKVRPKKVRPKFESFGKVVESLDEKRQKMALDYVAGKRYVDIAAENGVRISDVNAVVRMVQRICKRNDIVVKPYRHRGRLSMFKTDAATAKPDAQTGTPAAATTERTTDR